MDWEQVRIALLVATSPGLLMSLLTLDTLDKDDWLHEILTYLFAAAWVCLLVAHSLIMGAK